MKNPDEAIERVLTGLRDVEAPCGMERRVMYAVQGRASARDLSAPMLGLRTWAFAVGAVVVVAAVVSSMMLRRGLAVQQGARVEARAAMQEHAAIEARVATVKVKAYVATKATSAAKVESVDDENALAVSEMLAPSKPAPPLPLTHQERLLAEVVHHGEPEELAPLRSDVRAKQMEIGKAEFRDFFEPISLEEAAAVKDNE